MACSGVVRQRHRKITVLSLEIRNLADSFLLKLIYNQRTERKADLLNFTRGQEYDQTQHRFTLEIEKNSSQT